jgi:hypothetical protein
MSQGVQLVGCGHGLPQGVVVLRTVSGNGAAFFRLLGLARTMPFIDIE